MRSKFAAILLLLNTVFIGYGLFIATAGFRLLAKEKTTKVVHPPTDAEWAVLTNPEGGLVFLRQHVARLSDDSISLRRTLRDLFQLISGVGVWIALVSGVNLIGGWSLMRCARSPANAVRNHHRIEPIPGDPAA